MLLSFHSSTAGWGNVLFEQMKNNTRPLLVPSLRAPVCKTFDLEKSRVPRKESDYFRYMRGDYSGIPKEKIKVWNAYLRSASVGIGGRGDDDEIGDDYEYLDEDDLRFEINKIDEEAAKKDEEAIKKGSHIVDKEGLSAAQRERRDKLEKLIKGNEGNKKSNTVKEVQRQEQFAKIMEEKEKELLEKYPDGDIPLDEGIEQSLKTISSMKYTSRKIGLIKD